MRQKAGNGLFLLDVSTLIALAHPHHLAHRTVEVWFHQHAAERWATCPITECGFVRVASNPRFASPASPVETLQLLAILIEMPGHHFWPDDLAVGDVFGQFEERLFGHQQITDAYLLALAIAKEGRLVTLDRSIATLAGPEHAAHLLVL